VTAPNPSNRRRSERVLLQVPIIVRSQNRQRQTVEEETRTEVVNAHGGLTKLKMELLAGQPIVLVNARSKMEQSCRVVRVEHGAGTMSAVAFEFDQPAPHFWPVSFPPDDWGLPKPLKK
jgi:hypothetical protein